MINPRIAALVLASAASAAAVADDAMKIWVSPGWQSYHFDRSQDFREENYGLGAEVLLTPEHGFVAGTIINSNRERSRYGGYHWRPLRWQPAGVSVSGGLGLALIDGYPAVRAGGWFPAVLPFLAVEHGPLGANLIFIPNSSNGSALGLQLKLRVW
jgi:hypothetical protein